MHFELNWGIRKLNLDAWSLLKAFSIRDNVTNVGGDKNIFK